MTPGEVASYLRMSRATVARYMRSGRLPFYKVAGDRAVRIRQRDVEALLVPGGGPMQKESAND